MSPSVDAKPFYFRAAAPDGGLFTGQVHAISSDEALAQLRQKGFQPLRLEITPIRDAWMHRELTFASGKRLTTVDCESFCRELALLLRSGIVTVDAIGIALLSLKKGSRLFRFTTSTRNGIRLGRSLAEAVELSGFTYPEDLVPVLRAGEESGALPSALAMLAESFADANRFARTYLSALAYPVLLLAVSLIVFGLITFFVAPNLANLFVSMDRPIPLAIATFAGAADWMGHNGLALVLVGVATILSLWLGGGRILARQLRALLFRMPVLGSAMRWSASRRFAATLRLYLSSNVPIATALPNALVSSGFPGGMLQARRLAAQVREGGQLTQSLKAAKFLPAKLVHMIAVGESSGRLPEVLEAVVAEAKSRFEQRMSLVTALLAPLLILLVGSAIGTVIFSVFTALLDINEVVM